MVFVTRIGDVQLNTVVTANVNLQASCLAKFHEWKIETEWKKMKRFISISSKIIAVGSTSLCIHPNLF